MVAPICKPICTEKGSLFSRSSPTLVSCRQIFKMWAHKNFNYAPLFCLFYPPFVNTLLFYPAEQSSNLLRRIKIQPNHEHFFHELTFL